MKIFSGVKAVNILILLSLLFLPFLILGGKYYVGGDDMRLYYVFPGKYVENFALNVVTDNTLAGASTGYASVAYFVPMLWVISVLKSLIPVNIQNLMYGVNLMLGYYFFSKFVILITKKKINTSLILASLMYVFSPYLVGSLYKNQMLNLYLLSLLPVCLYFFYSGVLQKKYYKTVLSVLTFSVFSTTLNTLPWSLAFMIGASPMVLYLFVENKAVFFKHFVLWIVIFILLNGYWMFHLINAHLVANGTKDTLAYYSSIEFVTDNLRVTSGVARLFNPLNIVFYNMTPGLRKFTLVDIVYVFPFLVLLLGLASHTYKRKLTLFWLAAFSLSWYLFSPNMGDFGVKAFLKASREIPYFTMFRNMYDKFALPLTFTYAIGVYWGLDKLRKRKKAIKVVHVVFAVIIANGVMGYTSSTRGDNFSTKSFSGKFNDDFINLTKYLEKLPDSAKVLWLPLNSPTYLYIEDSESKYYFGLSPLRVLIDRTDVTGRFSFITRDNLFQGEKVFYLISNKAYKQVGDILKSQNVGYVVTNNLPAPDSLKSFLYGGDSYPLLGIQSEGFYKEILGSKLNSFGSRYSLYRINDRYLGDTLYLDNSDNLVYSKKSSSEYNILVHQGANRKLFFNEPYHVGWELISRSGEKINRYREEGNINSWELPSGENSYKLKFKPAQFNYYLFRATAIFYLTLIVFVTRTAYLDYNIAWRQKKK